MDKTLAARISLIIVTLGATAALFTGHIGQENFMILATAIFGAFFANR